MGKYLLKWDHDFDTGNLVIDSQHFNLVKTINELFEISVNNKSISIELINIIKNDLSKYINEHFKTEEELMIRYSVDLRHSDEHFKLHKEFSNEVSKFISNRTNLESPAKLNEVMEYLIRWLAYHILNTDKSLVRQIHSISNDKMSPSVAYDMEEEMDESSTEPLLKALKVLYRLVSKKNKEIEKKNLELEYKVKARTEELRKSNEQLKQMLLQDLLTGLPNRRFVMEEVQKLILNWERYETIFSVLFIDIDKFKEVNDKFGHDKGDLVLKILADFLCHNIRKTDIACRLGGDEFVIICSHTDQEGVIKIGQNLNQKIKKIDDHVVEFWEPSLSIGIATINEEIKTASDLLKIADSAMYISKKSGGGKISIV
ncbi:GGDEF domain-containing protein [Fusibacter tunisiensis]|uniref:Hemerythrin n=1 Tax=Fusibacter tunisiensis TaxID=1008308 RepID=A0ABS2MUE2_9FIRM|nr:diguanylate cyclase [Fusibacter tunisiensis]MBM7562995.1 hemerythrin [Fusibacter tunisiensis]